MRNRSKALAVNRFRCLDGCSNLLLITGASGKSFKEYGVMLPRQGSSSTKLNSMKQVLLFLAVIITSASSMNAQVRPGFTAGTIFSKYKVTYGDISVTTDSKMGITAGAFLDIPAGKSLTFQPALNYVQKGESTSGDLGSGKSVIHALEIPLNLLYHAGPVFVGAGPSVTYSLSGKTTYKDGSDEVKEDIKFGDSEDDDMHALDFGANFLAGYRFKGGFQLSAHCYAGLSNLAPGTGGGSKIKNSYFGFKLGYLLHH